MTMPPDHTPLTEAAIQRIEDLEAKATRAPWTTDSGSVPLGDTGDYEPYWFVNGNRKTNSQVASLAYCADEGDECDANMDLIAALRNAAPALLAAARENAERERTVGMCQKCGTRVAVKHGRVEEGGLLFHDVCHWERQREFLIAKNARLMNHLSGLLARVHRDGGHYEQKHGTDKARWDADEIVANLTAENAGLREERDAHNAARQRQMCTQDQWYSDQADHIAEMLIGRGIETYGVDKKPIRQEMNEHPVEQVLGGVITILTAERDHWKTAAESVTSTWQDVATERDAALARVAELEAQIRQMTAKYESLEDSYQDMLERGANLAAKVAVFERILTPSLPDPKWVRCPSACSDGMIHAGSGVWRGCFTCGSSGRPGWVKETPQ